MAVNTIAFIDDQLNQIENSLRQSEDDLERFRAENLIIDLNTESEQMLSFFIDLENERSTIELQRSVYFYVIDFLGKEGSIQGPLPTLSSFNDPLVSQLAANLSRRRKP